LTASGLVKFIEWRSQMIKIYLCLQSINNQQMIPAYFNWSGGKDSALALWKIQQQGHYDIRYLLTSVNAAFDRVSMHGVRRSLLEEQARLTGIPLTTLELPEQPDMEAYEKTMKDKVNWLKAQGCEQAIFGDIFLEDLKVYREQQLAREGITCVFPLWQQDSRQLVKEFIGAGFKSIVVCVNDKYLDRSFCGRVIDEQFIRDLPAGVDPCGENGEFHSFCVDGPVFSRPLAVKTGEYVYRQYDQPNGEGKYGFWYVDLLAETGNAG